MLNVPAYRGPESMNNGPMPTDGGGDRGAGFHIEAQLNKSVGNIFLKSPSVIPPGGGLQSPLAAGQQPPALAGGGPKVLFASTAGQQPPTTIGGHDWFGAGMPDYKPPTIDDNAFLKAMQPGADNVAYQTSLAKWKQSDPAGAAGFEQDVKDGLGGQDRKDAIVTRLQTAIHDGKISKQDAANLLGNGPGAGLFDLSSPGTTHASASAYALSTAMGGPLGGDSADPMNEPIPDNLQSKPDVDVQAYFTPGKDNPVYQKALDHWMQTNPDKAKAFVKNIDEGNAGAKGRNKQVVNDLQMAINRGEITKQEGAELISLGPAATWFHFDSPGHTGTSAGAFALANAMGGPLGGDSSDPKAAGRKYIASDIFSLGGALPNPISGALNPLG